MPEWPRLWAAADDPRVYRWHGRALATLAKGETWTLTGLAPSGAAIARLCIPDAIAADGSGALAHGMQDGQRGRVPVGELVVIIEPGVVRVFRGAIEHEHLARDRTLSLPAPLALRLFSEWHAWAHGNELVDDPSPLARARLTDVSGHASSLTQQMRRER